VLCLSVPPAFYESFGGDTDIERTPVLMSQPLMELCLRIPSYVWITGGRDRAIARRAFADVLPPAIVRRQQKGAIDQYNLRIFDANEAYVRDLLLDGLLVKEGLLDRARLERYLTRGASRTGFEYNDVLRHHLCTETWLRRWTQTSQSAAGRAVITSCVGYSG
jgi:asparagine synthase (glutamine-hydrolysing)